MKKAGLGEFEEIVLLIVAMLDGDAYSVNVTRRIQQETDRRVRLNQVHVALMRLEEKGMIHSSMGDPTPERGGRRKRMFSITAYGQRTLNDIRSLRENLWNLLPASMKLTMAKA